MRLRIGLSRSRFIGTLWAAWIVVLCGLACKGDGFYVNYSRHLDETVLRAQDLSIVHPENDLSPQSIRNLSGDLLAYISFVEIAADASYKQAAAAAGIKLVGQNEVWKSSLVDITAPAWSDFLIQRLAAPAMERGYDGIFFDTMDSIDLLIQKFPAREKEFREAAVRLVKAVRKAFPDKKIILNRGFTIWNEVASSVDGVLVESLFQTVELGTGQYTKTPAADTEWILGKCREAKSQGKEVLVLDYVSPQDQALASETAARIQAEGFQAFISTPELNGIALAPWKESPRKIIVLYGNSEEDPTERIRWPGDSEVFKKLQVPLEWLGYDLNYINPLLEPLPEGVASDVAGVIIDRPLALTRREEVQVVRWLALNKAAGKKILFFGSLNFYEPESLKILQKEFGIGGTMASLRNVENLRFTTMHPIMNYESKVVLLTNQFYDVQAPAGATRFLSLEGRSKGGTQKFDPIFITTWGGAFLDPYLFFRRPDYLEAWLFNPFEFLKAALATPSWPVPDDTTRDGMRIFYAHIDGDGLRNFSSVRPNTRSGQLIIDEVVKKYPYPFTCSVIESEIRGFVVGQPEGEEKELQAFSREMFALPNVEAGSHTYTHPFYWMEGDIGTQNYDSEQLELKPGVPDANPSLHRQLVGSVEYIERELLPPGKKVMLMQWSGNCRPGPEPLKILAEIGMENINGGETKASLKLPSLTLVSPRSISWGPYLQIHTAQQNENVYRERWQPTEERNNPFWGGYYQVMDTWERTGFPRRIKPVNFYIHFYIADNAASMRSATAAMDWVAKNELHALPTSTVVKIVRDCISSRIFQKSENEWRLSGNGINRTFRLDFKGKVPDMEKSRGVTGYVKEADATYLHTDGSKVVNLVLTDKSSEAIYLVKSSAEIKFSTLSQKTAAFTVTDFRPCKVVMGGLAPQTSTFVQINGQKQELKADAEGFITLNLPPEASVRIQGT